MVSPSIPRRSFLKAAGALGVAAAAGGSLSVGNPGVAIADDTAFPKPAQGKPVEAKVDPKTGEVTVNKDVIIRYSSCVGCYSSCANRLKLDRATGEILSVGGNPYNPACAEPYLPFDAPLEDAYRAMSFANGKGAKLHATVCARGKGTLDAVSQPDRITVPLKRAGARGEGKWRPISWDELIEEITEGGKLFAELGEDREIEGFKSIHDPVTPMDPEQPGLGPKSNQLLMWSSRGDGRGGLKTRFASTFGTMNSMGHNSSCAAAGGATSLYKSGSATVSDIDGAEYILWSGSFPGANGNNFQLVGKHVVECLKAGTLKIDVLDPTLSNGAVTPTMENIKWIPIKPATNGALYAAIAQILMRDKTYNADAMAFANYKAAVAGGYNAYSNASHLVVVDESHPHYKRLLRADEAGVAVAEGEDAAEIHVVIDAETGAPAAHTAVAKGELFFEGEVNGIKVRTGFSLMEETVNYYTIAEYAEITGVPADELERMGKEFASHGVRASVCTTSAATANVVGMDAPIGREVLTQMIGANGMVGGRMTKLSPTIEGKGKLYDTSTPADAPKVSKANATGISRGGKAWTKTDEYKNRKAAGEADPKPKLPWYANAPLSDTQTVMSVVNQYPYQCKIMLTWMGNPIQAGPGTFRQEVIDRLKDPDVLPLHIACDVVVGEMAQYADYIVPDVTQYESFGFPVLTRPGGYGTTVRWEASKPKVMQLDDGRYACWETLLIDIAKACDLPGWGEGAFTAADGTKWDFNNVYDYYAKALANLAYAEETPVDDITPEEMEMQGLDELPQAFKDAISAEELPKVMKILSRGGRYEEPNYLFSKDGRMKKSKPMEIWVYNEKRATTPNCYSGKTFEGTLAYHPQVFSDLSPMTDYYSAEEYPFTGSEHKAKFRSVSMLANSPLMRDLCEHNYVEINEVDAKNLGIRDGDTVRCITPAGDVTEGEAMVRAGQVQGAFAVSFGYGHLAYGAQDIEIDGELVPGNKAIAAGTRIVTMLDPIASKDGAMAIIADNDASSPGRCGGMFKIEKA